MTAPALTRRIHGTILAAFAADSLSLGAHWEYDSDRIASSFGGKVDRLAAPLSSFHKGKAAGEQTHIGDNSLYLLEHLASAPQHRFSLEDYFALWKGKWDTPTPPGYVDHATKHALEAAKQGKTGAELASNDDDLSHSSKFFPLLASYHSDEEELVTAVRQLVGRFQSGQHEAVTGEWLARVAFRVIVKQEKPSAAITAVTAQLNDGWLTERVQTGQASAALPDRDALRSFGEKRTLPHNGKTIWTSLSCSVMYGLPAVVHYVFKHEDAADPTDAIIEDVSIGGNSNARSIAVATLLFGYRGIENFKINGIIAGMKKRQQIEDLLAKIEAGQK